MARQQAGKRPLSQTRRKGQTRGGGGGRSTATAAAVAEHTFQGKIVEIRDNLEFRLDVLVDLWANAHTTVAGNPLF